MALGDYILGLLGLGAICVSLAIAARTARRALLPGWQGAPALLADAILALGLLVVLSQLLGLVGLLTGPLLVTACLIVAGAALRVSSTLRPEPEAEGGAPTAPTPFAEIAVAVAIALLVAVQWAGPTLLGWERGIYAGDSLWYHLPFAAHIAQTGSVTELLYTDPLYLNWFYPQNSELLHAVGLLLLGNDFLSPLLNLAWLALALLAAWCCGRPYGAGAAALAGIAALISANLLFSRQPGTANNDVVTIALLVSSAAILLNARWDGRGGGGGGGLTAGALIVAGLAAGLAAGTKLTALVPFVALTGAVVAFAVPGWRLRAGAAWIGAAIAGGGFWYARNLIVSGNPLPWLDLGPFPKAGELEGRDPFSIAHYLTDTDVWGRWFVPGLEERFGEIWPLALALAVAGVVAGLLSGRRVERMLAVVALISAIAYILTPLSAAGAEGSPVAFRLNIRYLAPALALAFVLVAIPPEYVRHRDRWWRTGALLCFGVLIVLSNGALGGIDGDRLAGSLLLAAAVIGIPIAAALAARRGVPRPALVAALAALAVIFAVIGRGVQTDYLDQRYSVKAPEYPASGEHPGTELSQGLGAGFEWARGISGARVGLSGGMGALFQYGLWGLDSSNQVRFLGERGERGSFSATEGCPEYVSAVNAGAFEYVVTTPGYDQDDPAGAVAPVERIWISHAPGAQRVAGDALVDVWQLAGPLDPEVCAPTAD